LEISKQQLPDWAETCLRINHLNTLVQREIEAKSLERAAELSERARVRAWKLFNELIAHGAEKPERFTEPGTNGHAAEA